MGRALIITFLVLASSSLSSGQTRVTRRARVKAAPAARVLRPLVSKIKKGSDVPVLLPSEFPPKWKRYKLYAYSEAEANEWKIYVGTEPVCGANVCMVGYFEAKRGEQPFGADEVDRVVKLARGIKGYYIGKSCGGSCTPPQIEWVYEGVLYTIQFRVESNSTRVDEAKIIEMANSAILNGER
jgi:hypothetical protein